ncbi:LOW QUALITY PROTEIN: GABA transporter 1-like [Dioscorea cayenensis subsp. rotundata]|uniref:LOW QUALITY PROTEIN: GABA transporter 1-like n=1 Tax=Dioscorea cayennensis subsp. rotundata TaxID=55577 RepID=A0AB40B4S1_DIOCR|nr:LOW QUALITY PROTEIN: GABA transporter 1-like [Dioscorea cayenensis subsp. rotundata]
MASQVRDAVDNNIEQVKVGSAAAVAAPTSSFEMDGSKRTDAGALFVLKSKGTWMHAGYHLTTSIVAPSILSLPYAFVKLGWACSVIFLFIGALVSFYNYNLVCLVLEHESKNGRRQLRFRDMGSDILGPAWGRYYIGPIQLIVCLAAVIGAILLGGTSMKAIYLVSNPEGTMKLYEFVIIFGCFVLLLAQIPSFHSLRYITFFSLVLCFAYAACATGGSIHAGNSSLNPPKDYSVPGNTRNIVFGVFNGIAIIGSTYGIGIIPEIQATVAPPVTGKMFKGLCVCYAVVMTTFFSVAISGYWAFGNLSQQIILSNFITGLGQFLVPKWFIRMTNIFTLLQLTAVAAVYMQPFNELLENLLGDPNKGEYSVRNVIPRLFSRSFVVAASTTLAAMLPFFGDLSAVIGAIGFMPLDFVIPVVFYNISFKPSKKSFIFWLNIVIAVVFSVLSVIGTVSAIRQVILDAKNYKLFADI